MITRWPSACSSTPPSRSRLTTGVLGAHTTRRPATRARGRSLPPPHELGEGDPLGEPRLGIAEKPQFSLVLRLHFVQAAVEDLVVAQDTEPVGTESVVPALTAPFGHEGHLSRLRKTVRYRPLRHLGDLVVCRRVEKLANRLMPRVKVRQ